jgi:LacI family transcriptional regulator
VRPRGAKVTLAEVARAAEVSVATASRTINYPERVAEDTRSRVFNAIRELNWIPHGAAKALASQRTRTVGALIPRLGHQGIAQVLEALQDVLGNAGYTLILGKPGASPERTLNQAVKMVEQGIEALVLMGEAQPPELIDYLDRAGIFYVTAWTSGHHGQRNCIGIDNYVAMSAMVEFLLDLGHRDFAVITRKPVPRDSIMQRIESVMQTLAGVGVALRPQHLVITDGWGIGAGRAAMRRLLTESLRPTAFICVNDYLAAGARLEALSAGFSIPADISICGFDDIELAAEFEPPITTVHVPASEIGSAVGTFIVTELDGGTARLPDPFVSTLVVRATTGAAPARRRS